MKDLSKYEIDDEKLEFIVGGAVGNEINVKCPKCGKNFKFTMGDSSYTCPHCKHTEKVNG